MKNYGGLRTPTTRLMLGYILFALALTLHLAIFAQTETQRVLGQNTTDDYTEKYDDLRHQEEKKAELERKIIDTQQKERTLGNQIQYLETQIDVTNLKQDQTRLEIDSAQEQLREVNTNIESLVGKLENLDGSMGNLNDVLSARIRTNYEIQLSQSGLILDPRGYQRTMLQSVYLKVLQKEDNLLMNKMRDMRMVYTQQKVELENLKQEKEELKAQLEEHNILLGQQKQDLSQQQATKNWLLGVTQNEEQQYQILLAQVEEEIRAIRNALTSLGTKIGEVKQGDIIAHVGNTGCSTGAHLHFGYYVNGAATDPSGKFTSGEFIWPVTDPVITQGFNDPNTRQWYQVNFGIDGHNGIDFVDAVVGLGAPVLAVADGIAYQVSDSHACWLTGTVGQGIRVDHLDGSKTIYWHIQ